MNGSCAPGGVSQRRQCRDGSWWREEEIPRGVEEEEKDGDVSDFPVVDEDFSAFRSDVGIDFSRDSEINCGTFSWFFFLFKEMEEVEFFCKMRTSQET